MGGQDPGRSDLATTRAAHPSGDPRQRRPSRRGAGRPAQSPRRGPRVLRSPGPGFPRGVDGTFVPPSGPSAMTAPGPSRLRVPNNVAVVLSTPSSEADPDQGHAYVASLPDGPLVVLDGPAFA